MNILIVSPHPDDAEIGLGASMARWVKEGHQVTIAVCTGEGTLTMVHSGESIKFHQRKVEQIEAATLVGAKVAFLDLAPAGRFDQKGHMPFVASFDLLFRDYDTVCVPLDSANEDHCVVWRAALAAFRQGKLDKVTLYGYHHPMQHWGSTVNTSMGRTYMPVTWEQVQTKVQLIALHKSQFAARTGPGLYSPKQIISHAEAIGAECGSEYAEVMTLVRMKIGM